MLVLDTCYNSIELLAVCSVHKGVNRNLNLKEKHVFIQAIVKNE